MKNQKEIVLGALAIVLVLITLAAYLAAPTPNLFAEATAIIVIVLVTFAAYTIWDRARNVSKGLPAKDERLANVSYRAGYYAFIAAIWSAVFAPMIYDGIFGLELEGHLVTAIVVIISAFTFVLSYLYLARKGK